jgi:KDO2-lipid IV(A) lauroyltransferase
MRHVLGCNAPASEVKTTAKEAFRNVARYYTDLVRLPETTPEKLLEKEIRLYGLEALQDAASRGKGVVVATAHFGNPEMALQVAAALGLRVLVLAEPLQPPAFAELMTGIRSTFGPRYVDVGYGAISEALRHLRGGGVLAITCDRDIQGKGTPMPFFGAVTRIPLGAAEIAARTDSLLVPGYCRRRKGGFDVVFEAPIELVDTGNAKQDAVTNTRALLARAECWIRSDPGQWMVLERIWKPGIPARGEPPAADATIAARGHGQS